MKKTYKGSCKCGKVKFEADIDFATAETHKCNCTSCWKSRWWSVKVKPDAFRSIAGEEELSKYVPGKSGGFCKHCGITPYGYVAAAEWNSGEEFSVNVAALDDLEPAELLQAQVKFYDGKADNWWHQPAETRHL
jgi:hypothetical protein